MPHTDATAPPTHMLRVTQLSKRYQAVPVFEGVSFSARRGEFVALVGESGVGKSSLLNCLAGLDDWQSGQVVVGGVDLQTLNETQRAHWRRSAIGFVFQAFHVLPHLDVAQNVRLPLLLLQDAKAPQAEPLTPAHIDARVQAALDGVGLGALGQRLPRELSGGQLQRVAIARALVHRPALVLADEPTGNLDPSTAATVMDTLIAQVRATGATLVMVTHAKTAAQMADRVLTLTAQGIADPG